MFDDAHLFLTDVFAGHARRSPKKSAIVCDDASLTWEEFDTLMNRIANALLRDGLQKGDRVAVLMGPSVECIATMFGCVRAGAILVPCGTMLTDDQLTVLLRDSGARALVASAEFQEQVKAVARHLPDLAEDWRVALGWQADGWVAFDRFIRDASPLTPEIRFAPGDPFSIMYSSGTTGLPKGVVHSQRARSFFAISNAVEMGFGPHSRTAISTALYTAASWIMLVPTLFAGGTVRLLAGFDPAELLHNVSEEKITHTFLVPSQILMVLQEDDLKKHDVSSLRTVLSAGSPLRPDVKRRWIDFVGNAFYELYGFTEGAATLLRPEDHATRANSVGAPILGTEFVVIGPDGAVLPPGSDGELCGYCPGLMTHYYNRPEATESAIWRDPMGRSFMRSGDIGRMDAQGFVQILDRKKDMIISGGLNVYPTDLEAVLGEHPDVRDVAVIESPDEKWGERPVAFVIPAREMKSQADEIKDWANQRLAKYQRIHDLRFVEDLPRNALGKVLKREMREAFASSLNV
ncbi:AMP-binding protein [Sulfitobacter sp. F26204]|uniref:class I adenylate-forming enzyme family protein n=1 Tax=Sulfitobacter sp. F26204 TaxID=2996014 RepID=UPI00225DE3E0|nr:AMP-binding protein [Sulfitobacter sp. F26204]MCX7560627.1 AMP-binding protein [Sulfitobacter sp. F26204]